MYLSKVMNEYNKRRRVRPDPTLGLLEEESSHDSGDDADFDVHLLFDSDDDTNINACQRCLSSKLSPADELT